jgi:hypothetical protein
MEAIRGGRFVADETDAAFLKFDDSVNRPIIDQAVRDFVRSGVWPAALTFAQLDNLMHRLAATSYLLQQLLKGTGDQVIGIPIVDPGDYAKFAQWLLIDTWNVGGTAYIKGLTDAFLAEKPQSRKET